MKKYSQYGSARDYFQAYTLTGAALSALTLPASLFTAEDDPIIAVSDFHRLRLPSSASLVISRNGQHNGFLRRLRLRSYYEQDLPGFFNFPVNACF